MFKTLASAGGNAAQRTMGGAEDAVPGMRSSFQDLAFRVQELEAQLRQRDEEIRVLAAMRRAITVAG